MDGATEYYAKWKKLVIERQVSWLHSYVELKQSKTKQNKTKQMSKGEKRERGKPIQTLNYRDQTDGYQKGAGGGGMS